MRFKKKMIKIYGNFLKKKLKMKKKKKLKINKMTLKIKVALKLQATKVHQERVNQIRKAVRHYEDQQGKFKHLLGIKIML